MKKCLNCKKEIIDTDPKRKFCSKSCSATYNNKNRKVNFGKKIIHCSNCDKPVEVDVRTSKIHCEICKVIKTKERVDRSKSKIKKVKIEKECKRCQSPGLEGRKVYCDSCSFSFYDVYRPRCKFKFSLKEYFEEFNFELVEKYGWYSASNRGGNLNGVSRDHMFSVRSGFELGIDPEIISHPANCKLMLHSKNSSKNNGNSITLEELKERIEMFKIKYE